MKMTFKNISPDEKSFSVNALHKAMAALAIFVSKKEREEGQAGQDTVKKVRALQKKLKLDVDVDVLVDEATWIGIVENLEKRESAMGKKRFTVQGTVRNANGSIKKRQQLFAFDLDLRGVGAYRDATNIAEIKKNGGFEYLGETDSDVKGNYEITFHEWQYARAEREKADVVVFAVEGEDIVGISRMVNSEDYSAKGLVQNLDVVIRSTDKRTEYKVMMTIISAFLKKSRVALTDISDSRDQLVFLAGELDLDKTRVDIVANAEILSRKLDNNQAHELIYGVGRQGVKLAWSALYKKTREELLTAIGNSITNNIIKKVKKQEIVDFIEELKVISGSEILKKKPDGSENKLDVLLRNALPEESQRSSFLNSLASYKGGDYREFWQKQLPAQPEFKNKPKLISGLLLTQQLTLLSGNHQPLIEELQVKRKVDSVEKLMDFEHKDWLEIVKKTGVPKFIDEDDQNKAAEIYADVIQSLVNAALPTKRVAKMLAKDEIPVKDGGVKKGLGKFFAENSKFDIASSRIQDFEKELKASTGKLFEESKQELKKIQRVFQVSTSPQAMTVLLEDNLHSSYTIAGIPRKSFVKTYAGKLGGERVAYAIHQRASHINTKSEMAAMHIMEYTDGNTPKYAMDQLALTQSIAALKKQIPNYEELFGSPDICECEHCRSVLSAAAYFVELLRFLWRGETNGDGLTPIDLLAARRPDLLHLPLTCENTNTIIPYVDLVNEVMEYYTANGSLLNFKGHDTGEASAAELRANPQNLELEAYRNLKDAPYPFTLPYHQPLDVIRTFGDHLKASRYDTVKVMQPDGGSVVSKALAAESLRLSQEEYVILTGEAFDGTADATPLHEYYGYSAASQLEDLSQVREFLQRSGVTYTDLADLLKTSFLNPHRSTLDFIEKVFADATIDANTIYARLGEIEGGTIDAAGEAEITAALASYNTKNETDLSLTAFKDWVTENVAEFRQVITLYEPDSKCDLDTTKLRTIQSIYEGDSTSGIGDDVWSRFHRFIRLWRKLAWNIHETDLMLVAQAESDIATTTIDKLESVYMLGKASKLPLNRLAVLWGDIDTYGKKSLYKKIFLNKAVQQIDAAFEADKWGMFLQDDSELLVDHQSAILAAFRITEEELLTILESARVIDGGNPRPLDINTDKLNLQNLSTVYRFVALAKSLKLKITDFCSLASLFHATPFSIWDIQAEQYTNVSPSDTFDFYELAGSVKASGFKTAVLEYIFEGTLPVDSKTGIDKEKILDIARGIRDTFSGIEQDHPQQPETPLTLEALTAKLSLTFQPEIVSQLMAIIESSASFETITDDNLNVVIPDGLLAKYSYVNGSGRLVCRGVMSDAERATLKGLANVNANFETAVDELYAAPEIVISENFAGVFDDLIAANARLLDHPAQVSATSLDDKLVFVHEYFLPLLKTKLREDAITQYITALIGVSQEATKLLVADDIVNLLSDLSEEGLSATYYSDATWSTAVLERVDTNVDFSWGNNAPDPLVPADHFSVRWKSYVTPPASGDYTLIVEVEEADDIFNLYLDDELILNKVGGDAIIRWEKTVPNLNASQMYSLSLEYAEKTQLAGVRLYWKTDTTAVEPIPASSCYPVRLLDAFVDKVTIYHRAAKFIAGFELSETELDHFIRFSADFDNIDFMALQAGHWGRIHDYMELRNSIPQAQALLTDVFALANRMTPALTVDELREMLHLATAWDKASLKYLVDTHFSMGVADFKNEIALRRVQDVMKLVSRTGISAETISEWGKVENDFDVLHGIAQLIKNTVKAKYEEGTWLDIAGDLSDTVRENQKQALVPYLLTLADIKAWGAKDADGLFEYLLIDVQMKTCMDTSRIVQANAALQMFVNRCLLNLESDKSSGDEEGVSPEAIDKDRWEWIKNYRVWEANRKVFLYPENWLEPEWRNDRSMFFRDLESYLVQNDITERSVEQGFRDYLTSLNDVANLEVCGMHKESDDDNNLRTLHVFARTHNTPHKYFYRTWNKYRKWSAWEKVPLDIRSIESGTSSGVHLLPVVWKKRLFLFWPEFMETQREATGYRNKTAEVAAKDNMSTLEASKYWEVRLAWSELVDGKWGAKKVSMAYVEEWPNWPGDFFSEPKDLLLTAYVTDSTQELRITVNDAYFQNKLKPKYIQRRAFWLSDIQSPVNTWHTYFIFNGAVEREESDYQYSFNKRQGDSKLELEGDVYLNRGTRHDLLPLDSMKGLEITLDDPFFFNDAYRTYFVRPVDITVREWIQSPELYRPIYVELIETEKPMAPPASDPLIRFEEEVGDFDPRTAEIGAVGVIHDFASAGQPRTAAVRGGRETTTMPLMMRSTGSSPDIKTSWETNSIKYGIGKSYIEAAFGWSNNVRYPGYWSTRQDAGLEFHTFYHPYSSDYVTNLNQGGLRRLMESDTEFTSDEGSTFENVYDPNFSNGFVQKPSDFSDRTYYKENVCFDAYGANSIYNWELFFHAPLYIATRLSRNGKHEEAMKWFHFIFDPTTDDQPGDGESEISRYWKVLPFKTTPAESLEGWFRDLSPNADPNTENAIIGEWRDNPFDPHLVASNRPLAYMKHVVIKYVENLIAWGDSKFRQFTRENVNDALQLYVIASHILGPRPEFVPRRGETKAESYFSLRDKWDDFSNALVELENIFPYSSEVNVSESSVGNSLLGIGSALYFCIPTNNKLLDYWDTVTDRLFKIRHCRDIDGVERKLALFAPPIDPAALIQARSQGISLGSILADLSSPPPIYRFTYLIQKVNEFCSDVKALGGALLSVLEKKDAEELSRLRASHETSMLELITAVRERQILDAKANRENLVKARDTAAFRVQHYIDLLGNEAIVIPGIPTISATLTADSQLPVDTTISTIVPDVDQSLVESDESGVKLIPKEELELSKSLDAMIAQAVAARMEGLAGVAHFFPNATIDLEPFGVGGEVQIGGSNIGSAISALAKIPQIDGQVFAFEAAQAIKMASYIRREQDWTLQANLAARQIVELDKQITSADIRLQMAEKELQNHLQQIDNDKEVELFLKDKFTNVELYQWMKEQLFSVYKQSYNLAYEMAKKAEKAYKYELGTELTSFIQYGYWDNSKQGLASGEKLQLALRQLESSYLDENRRELELRKSVSLALVSPLALIELKETGKCYISLPEELFDLDFQGHYFRRIKSVSLTLPCIAGPHTSVNCSLRLLDNSTRINTSMNSAGNYEHENDEGLLIDDDRFRISHVPVTSIATSDAQNDSGLFEFNFRDERYLPFEGSGVISEWELQLSTEAELRQFDYSTISDVVLHINYMARENGGLFKEEAVDYIKSFIENAADLSDQPLMRMFSMKHEFPTEWHRFLHPSAGGSEQLLEFIIGKARFPFFAQDRDITVMKLEVFAKCTQGGDYHAVITNINKSGDPVTSSQINMPEDGNYGGLKHALLDTTDAGLNLQELDVSSEMSLKIKHNSAGDYVSLLTSPDEVEDMMLVLHYKMV